MNFQPLGNRVLIKQAVEESTTASGIILPDSSKEKPKTGEVLAIGNGVEQIKIGDTIVFGKYAGRGITLDKEEYLILDMDDVQGIILNKE